MFKETDSLKKKQYDEVLIQSNKRIFFYISLILVSAIACYGITIYLSLPCKHEYTESNIHEPTYSMDGSKDLYCKKCNDRHTETIPKLEMPVEIRILDKEDVVIEGKLHEYTLSDGRPFSYQTPDTYRINYNIEIKNISDKPVKKLEWTLFITDKTKADRTLHIYCTYDDIIPPNETITYTQSTDTELYSLSDLSESSFGTFYGRLIHGVSHEDLKYEIQLNSAEFAD